MKPRVKKPPNSKKFIEEIDRIQKVFNDGIDADSLRYYAMKAMQQAVDTHKENSVKQVKSELDTFANNVLKDTEEQTTRLRSELETIAKNNSETVKEHMNTTVEDRISSVKSDADKRDKRIDEKIFNVESQNKKLKGALLVLAIALVIDFCVRTFL